MADKIKIYIGPSVPGLKKYTLLAGPFSDLVQNIIKKEPPVGGLIVPVSELAQARIDIERPGTPLNLFKNQLLNRSK